MRASRLVSLLLLLQTRGQMTAAELATQLEVSPRTILRDVDALSMAGVPIYCERGSLGGVRLVDGYRTRLTGMTADEADALFLSGLPGPAAELGLGTVMTAARLKVLAALPTELRARASRLVERFHLDAAAWFRSSDAVPHLPALSQGVWDGTRLRIRYRREDDEVERLVEPLGVVLKAGAWYLVAVADGQIRTYRVSRVLSVDVLADRFERPPDFDLAAYWQESTAAFEREVPRVEVIAGVRAQRMPMLHDVIGDSGSLDILGPIAEPDREVGWLRVRLLLDWPHEVPGRLLAMGADLEVLEPAEVRRQVIDLARAISVVYA
jgi:predicted DNA-binding transcriptional regulator YafY